MHQIDAHHQGVALGDSVGPDVDVGRQHVTPREIDDRPTALYLKDCRLAVFVVLGLGLLGQARQHLWVTGDPFEGPRQSGGGGLVAGRQQSE